jgi:hypothetical protein
MPETKTTTVAKKAAAPQDHKPKTERPKVDTVEIQVGDGDQKRTVKARRVALRGIVVTIPEEALDDFEVLDDIRAIQDSDDASRMPALLRRLTGDQKEYRRILDALRGPGGRVTIEDGGKFVMELFEALGAGAS